MRGRRGRRMAAMALTAALAAAGGDAGRSERTPARQHIAPAAEQRAELPSLKPGAAPEAKPAAGLVGTWRVRLQRKEDAASGVVYTFTADGRVTVGPGQVCRYRIENEALSIDCTGATAASASGPLERVDADTLVWRVGDKRVRLERQAGVKEQ